MVALSWLDERDRTWFPPGDRALRDPDGLLAAGGDLSAERLINAYRRGIFPWYEGDQPILWWSPDPRFVLYPSDIRVSRSLRKVLRRDCFEVRADSAFADVVQACSELRRDQGGTWITPAMFAAYCNLHKLGVAHSVETWRDGRLVGGLYGVALGRVFFGESMFYRETDASKVALVVLCRRLVECGFELVDCQVATQHLSSLGAVAIRRKEFETRVAEAVDHVPLASPWLRGELSLVPPLNL